MLQRAGNSGGSSGQAENVSVLQTLGEGELSLLYFLYSDFNV